MIGLAILGAAALYCAVWAIAFKMVPTAGAKVIVALVGIGIPAWDLPYEYYYFKSKCSAEGGLHVFNAFEAQEVVILDRSYPALVEDLLSEGIRYVERRDANGMWQRFERPTERPITQMTVPAATAKVRLRAEMNKNIGSGTTRHDYLVERVNGNILLRYTRLTWKGGWLRERMSPLLGHGSDCALSSVDLVSRSIRDGSKVQ
ncbi:MAG: hypothetical protein HY017_01335 [Betaproteobacteria bacterium]|nr:hypothetical protein [Betaproteobacteria bacterium]